MRDWRRVPLPRLARGAQKELTIAGLHLALAIAAAFARPGVATAVAVAVLLIPFAVLLYFFRDPERSPPHDDAVVLSAADGEVDAVEWVSEPTYLQSEALRISVFMSLLDVHVNRAPVDGRVVSVKHVPGRFLQAFRPEAAQENEHNLIALYAPLGPVLVKQIAGVMARRVVCWVNAGDEVQAGDRVGLVKFGSRVDVFLPKGVAPTVRIGDKTRAGVTPIARWQQERPYDRDPS